RSRNGGIIGTRLSGLGISQALRIEGVDLRHAASQPEHQAAVGASPRAAQCPRRVSTPGNGSEAGHACTGTNRMRHEFSTVHHTRSVLGMAWYSAKPIS